MIAGTRLEPMLRARPLYSHALVSPRRPLLAALLAAALLLAGCRQGDVGPRMSKSLDEAREWRTQLVETSRRIHPDSAEPVLLISLGYLERARLGMGSPFRLAHSASIDTRLPEPVRRQAAWAILAMTVDGQVYHPQWGALDSLMVSMRNSGITGEQHGGIIERTILGDDDPRAGELAVRIAYRLAVAEGLVRSNAILPVGRAAALVRDRAIARNDAVALLRTAEREDADVMQLLRTWRATRRFAVEQPVLAQATGAGEKAAIARAASVLGQLREVAQADSGFVGDALVDPPTESEPFLTRELGSRLGDLPSVRAAPPQAPIRVAVEGLRFSVMRAPTTRERNERARFVDRAKAEESLVAEYARIGDDAGRAPARVALWAAASMRTYGQEEPWQLGAGGPTVGELKSRFGLASISYDAELPAEWRPYFNRMLASALSDLQRVFPNFSVRGVGVHFGAHPLAEPALAVHQPRTRTIYLPPETGAGAIAHEFAHDLDWQVATKLTGRRGEYMTDVAVREQRGPLAARMAQLTTAALAPPRADEPARMPPRPTEVFARSVDWYVAASLARLGRTNGYLTAVQDELLTGYASSLPPDAAGEAAEAMMATLDEMSAADPESREWYLEQYGRNRAMNAFDLTRHVLDRWNAAPPAGSPPGAMPTVASRLIPLGTLTAPEALKSWAVLDPLCAAALDNDEGLTRARGQLVWMTAESVARGLMAERARTTRSPRADARITSVDQAPWDSAVTQARLEDVTREVLARLSVSGRARVPGAAGRC